MTVRSLSLVAAALTLTAATASAQSTYARPMRVTIPIAFSVSSVHFTPGTYTISMVNHWTLVITNGAQSAMILTNEEFNKTADQGKVILHRYGTEYFLESVFRAGQNIHVKCVKTREESQAEKAQKSNVIQLAMTEQPTPVELAVLAQAN